MVLQEDFFYGQVFSLNNFLPMVP